MAVYNFYRKDQKTLVAGLKIDGMTQDFIKNNSLYIEKLISFLEVSGIIY